MLHRLALPALALLVALAAAPPAQAQAAEIEQLLRERDRQIKAILGPSGEPTGAQRERLRAVINEAIDFEAMAQTALGPFWNEFTPAQRARFVERFAAVVRQQSLADLELYRARVAYEGVTVTGNTAVARTVATQDGRRARVDYHLHRVGGQWRVTDIVIDGVGTAEGYARSFQRVLRRDGPTRGYERLMESLERRLERGS